MRSSLCQYNEGQHKESQTTDLLRLSQSLNLGGAVARCYSVAMASVWHALFYGNNMDGLTADLMRG
ncbi:hypothetical protein CJP72_05405 [Citrobacter sp. NCU1]|nr:hypothetical protein [Citrobacter sp. NCU1]